MPAIAVFGFSLRSRTTHTSPLSISSHPNSARKDIVHDKVSQRRSAARERASEESGVGWESHSWIVVETRPGPAVDGRPEEAMGVEGMSSTARQVSHSRSRGRGRVSDAARTGARDGDVWPVGPSCSDVLASYHGIPTGYRQSTLQKTGKEDRHARGKTGWPTALLTR